MAAAFLISLRAALRGGYIGPDYPTHLARLIEWPKVFDFSASNPPIYYLFGHALFTLIGPHNVFPITLSIFQSAINLAVLWCFFRLVRPRFESTIVFAAFSLFLIFLPVRLIHAATIGADSMTVPLFVLFLVVFDKFWRSETVRSAAALGSVLCLAIWTKYGFMALIPALLIVLVSLALKGHWNWRRFLGISVLALALPIGLSIHSFWASSRTHGYNTEKHWRQQGVPPEMDFKDLLSVKRSDLQLFRAPEYFKREILLPHVHSYLALSHMGVFTDTMNLFQELSVSQDFGRVLIPDQKTRKPWKTPVMSMSMLLGTIWTAFALIGTAWLSISTLRRLTKGDLEREHISILFGIAYFLLMFLPIPAVHAGALFGYWTPRLILPALLAFFLAAFLFIDRRLAAKSRAAAVVVFGLTSVQCAIEIVMLA
jgi:hypothetical protein